MMWRMLRETAKCQAARSWKEALGVLLYFWGWALGLNQPLKPKFVFADGIHFRAERTRQEQLVPRAPDSRQAILDFH